MTFKHEDAIRDELAAQYDAAWGALLQHEAGRMVVFSILDTCGIWSIISPGEYSDYNLGRHSVGQQVLHEFILPHGMDKYTKLLSESDERRKRITAAIEKDQQSDDE